jgi:NAD(P)-dependent dehydrogenase (short-subunit alcohol dehydrogenase family)
MSAYPAPFDLDGKVAVVTGAARGLGIEFAEAMAEAGAHVACADLQDASATVARVEALGREAPAIECDVSSEASVEAMVAAVVERFGRLDILFNNAGIADAVPGPLHEYPSENWHQVHRHRPARRVLLREALPESDNGAGVRQVINIASIWGITGASSVFPIPASNAAKGAVVNLTRELGLQYATAGIQANAISPGSSSAGSPAAHMTTPSSRPRWRASRRWDGSARRGRSGGAAIFLASDASSYMTGQMLELDGGVRAK